MENHRQNTEYLDIIRKLVDRIAYLTEYADDLQSHLQDMERYFEQAEEARAKLQESNEQMAEITDKRVDSMMRKVRQLEIDLDARNTAIKELGETFKQYRNDTAEECDHYRDEIRGLRSQLARQREFIKAIQVELANHLTPWDYDRAVDLFGLPDLADDLPPFEIPDDFFEEEGEDDGD